MSKPEVEVKRVSPGVKSLMPWGPPHLVVVTSCRTCWVKHRPAASGVAQHVGISAQLCLAAGPSHSVYTPGRSCQGFLFVLRESMENVCRGDPWCGGA